MPNLLNSNILHTKSKQTSLIANDNVCNDNRNNENDRSASCHNSFYTSDNNRAVSNKNGFA